MTVETFTDTAPDELNVNLPASGDSRTEGDNHLRNIKNVIKTTFANVSGPVTSSEAELNYVDISALGTWQAGKALTAAATSGAINCANLAMTNINIDSGAITGVSLANNTVTAGLTWNAAQNLNSQALTNVNIDSGNIASAVVLADGITATTQASTDDSTKIATTAFVNNIVNSQAWQDVAGSRTIGATKNANIYTNSTASPITVSVYIQLSETNTMECWVGSGATPNVRVAYHAFSDDGGGSGWNKISQTFVVPAGHTYSVNSNTAWTDKDWAELR